LSAHSFEATPRSVRAVSLASGIWQFSGFAENFGSVCHARAPAAKEARFADELEQLTRAPLDFAFRPVAKGFCHAEKKLIMPGCASLATEVASINDLNTMSTQTATKKASSTVIEGLQTVLADSYALMAQTHLAHWNVEGPNFFQLHTAFQGQYEELFAAVDEIAERLRALDVLAIGGVKTLAKGFVAHLIESHEIVLGNAHALREAAGSADDLETQDLIIGRIQVHQKTLWMLKSFLKNL
jgi:starvation-inducible DNA-binding protein